MSSCACIQVYSRLAAVLGSLHLGLGQVAALEQLTELISHVQLCVHTGLLTLGCCAGLAAPQLRRGGSPRAAGRADEVTWRKGSLQDCL